MDSNDLLKARADEREQNFYSLRTVEWAVVFQSYTGFAVVAVVYHQLQASQGWWLGASATTAISLLLLTSIYLSLRIQERLHMNRNIQNRFYDELHRRLKVERFDVLNGGPIHGRWYAFGSHLFVSLAIYLAIVAYVLATTPRAGLVALLTGAVAVVVTVIGSFLGWLRTHPGTVGIIPPPVGNVAEENAREHEQGQTTIGLTHEQHFAALLARFQDHVELLRSLTMFDLQIVGGFMALQLGLAAWLVDHRPETDALRYGLLALSGLLTGLAMKVLYNDSRRRKEVVESLSRTKKALGFDAKGMYLPDQSLDAPTTFRPWWPWYIIVCSLTFIAVGVIILWGGFSAAA